jgi:hypothetical protein
MDSSPFIHPLSPPENSRFRRRMFYLRHLLKRSFLIQKDYPLEIFGDLSSGCAYSLCPADLGPKSIVYSGGVGKNVSFEQALVKRFSCSVVLFDPSPIGKATMQLPENQNSRFQFFPVGLAGKCGTLRLAPPFESDGDSWFQNTKGSLEVPAWT